MGTRKIKTREISDNLTRLVSPIDASRLRPSAGKENTISEYYNINVVDLLPYAKQARRNFAEEELAGLAETILEHGIRNPLTVIGVKEQQGKFYVVSGERRLLAAKKVGITRVPCIILENPDSAPHVALIENIQRSDLHPIELSNALDELDKDLLHGDKTQIAHKLGLTLPKFSEVLSYSRFPESVKAALLERDIRSRSVYRRLKACKTEDAMLALLGLDQLNNPRRKRKEILKFFIEGGVVSCKKAAVNMSSAQRADLISVLEKLISDLKKS